MYSRMEFCLDFINIDMNLCLFLLGLIGNMNSETGSYDQFLNYCE